MYLFWRSDNLSFSFLLNIARFKSFHLSFRNGVTRLLSLEVNVRNVRVTALPARNVRVTALLARKV